MPNAEELRARLLSVAEKHLLPEGIARIRKCLDQLSEEQIWFRPNPASNSIGNLILHLCGNVTQWLICSFSEKQDQRDRPMEFELRGISKAELLDRLTSLEEEIVTVLPQIATEQLLQEFAVQTFREQGLDIIVHVIEHFSYHTGQITYITKMLLDQQVGYYEGVALDIQKLQPPQ